MPKAENLGDIGAKRQSLTEDEEDELRKSFQRSLEDTRALDTEVIREKLMEYWDEVMVAAEVAREELNGSFDGQSPTSGNFGIDTIHPGYFGYDDWDDMPTVTGGAVNNWIDSDSPSNLASGDGGGFADPLGIGDPVVHIILGYGSYASDPAVSRLKEEKNDNPMPAVTTEDAFRNTDLRIKWLDTPRVLSPDDDFAVEVYGGGEAGTDYEDAVYPIGLTFIEAKAYRILDPADMAGTDQSNVVVEQ